MISWRLENRKISKLKPHPSNPRMLSKADGEQLSQSLEKFGCIDKPIINLDNTIIGGHQRIKLLKKQGIKEIECWVPNEELSPDDVSELCIRLNKNTGEWDWDTLANEWEPEALIEWGFTEKELGLGEDEEQEEVEMSNNKNEDKIKTCPHCGEEI